MSREPKADLNVTPLIDVLLVLLVIFMLVAPGAPSALDASLPRPDGERSHRAPGVTLVVEPTAFVLEGTTLLTLGSLEARLREALQARPERTVFVRAAAGVDYGRVVDAVDLARGCGAQRIGLLDSLPPAGR